jgi:hypothetical protein
MMLRKIIKWSAIFVAVAFVAIQFFPYGRDHTNPPVSTEPQWDSALTRELAVESCYSCHSNETEWPWYSNIAPMSWLVQRDVEIGREEFNFSELDRDDEADEAAETVAEGEMPPLRYVLAHPSARLTEEEKQALTEGLTRMFGGGDSSGSGGGDDDDD